MYKPLSLIGTIAEESRETCYLFNKVESILLPIAISPQQVQTTRHITLLQAIQSLGAHVVAVSIYMELAGKYYTHLCLQRQEKTIEISIDPIEAISLVHKLAIPLRIAEEVMYKNGFYITKKMVLEALEENPQRGA
jgi:bifunctional DNase/RNase